MDKKLIDVIINETNALENLLALLQEQYLYIMKKDVFSIEEVVEKIKLSNKEIAQEEVNRRKLVGNKPMSEVINESNNKELESVYRNIRKMIHSVTQQKETNELLIKQQIGFNTQMLNLINPRRDVKTYTSMGNLSR
ncbi:MAG: flagellar protein FlgN [Clostridium sp.]|nr:flagellar protein FlgN [Clostridium sp.]